MSFSTTTTALMTNPELNPTFLEDTPVVLDKDYTQSDPFCSRYLTKNAVGTVVQCGLSEYAYNSEEDGYNKLIDETDWCFIEVATPRAYFENSQCWVKAEDLIDLTTLSDEDLINRGLREFIISGKSSISKKFNNFFRRSFSI